MKKQFNDIHDFLDDSSFQELVLQADVQSQKAWDAWLRNNPEKEEELKAAKKLLTLLAGNKEPVSELEARHQFNKLMTNLHEVKSRKTVWINKLIRIAAVLLITIGLGYTAFFMVENGYIQIPTELATIQKVEKVAPGQKMTIHLSDGSKVILNSNSTFKYPEKFAGDDRVVELEGEAYFDVAQKNSKRFLVKTGEVTTEVLGTQFNVNAFSKSGEVRVSLVSGKVHVIMPDNNNEFLMPGEGVVYHKTDQDHKKVQFDHKEVLAWKDHIIYFKRASLNEVVLKLENWYGIEVVFDNTTDVPWKFSGEFRNASLHTVMEGLMYTKEIDYNIVHKKVHIKFNK